MINMNLAPKNPFDGQVWTINGVKYVYMNSQWVPVEQPPPKDGAPGKSAYELAGGDAVWTSIDLWLVSLKSTVPGPKGADSTVPGPKGADAVISGIVESPIRDFNIAFRPSATLVTSVYYTVDLNAGVSLNVGSQTSGVQLLCDAANPPVTIRDEVSFTLAGTLTLNLGLSQVQRRTLSFLVPKSWYVMLKKTGAGASTLIRQNEVMF
ncbi:hypothetical protein [Xanthomonas phage XAJ2]|uniref:Uncharacterized protein n=1 Tax=Xanthomonas phage XAJ2 TaxID=1775249 RepID=A0A1I9L2F5_9CAUD|nr:hypothetical protein [Xanthomonas phage XAJ2]